MDHLQGIFIIFISLVIASVAAFVAELYIADKNERNKKRFKSRREVIKLRKLRNKNYYRKYDR